MVFALNFAPHFWCSFTTSTEHLHFQLNILKISLQPFRGTNTNCPPSLWCTCGRVDVCFSVCVYVCVLQVTFSDAMRSKARLSVTGSTGENGRVMSPEFPKAVHAVPFVRPGVGMNVSLTDLSWWIRTCRVPYTMVFNRAHSILFPVALSLITRLNGGWRPHLMSYRHNPSLALYNKRCTLYYWTDIKTHSLTELMTSIYPPTQPT